MEWRTCGRPSPRSTCAVLEWGVGRHTTEDGPLHVTRADPTCRDKFEDLMIRAVEMLEAAQTAQHELALCADSLEAMSARLMGADGGGRDRKVHGCGHWSPLHSDSPAGSR